MQIKFNEYPPNFEAINTTFKLTGAEIFTYGDTIYNPKNFPLHNDLLQHEMVHMAQQKAEGPEKWWAQYLIDPVFRVAQEIPAYRVQYQVAKAMLKDRNQLAQYLHKLASDLSSPIYGSCISRNEALAYIQNNKPL